MNLQEAKEAVAALQAQKNELDAILAGLFGGKVAVPTEALYGSDPYVALIGKGVYIRQATFHLTGRLASVGASELVLDDASTVFSSGELGAFLKGGKAAEAEPMGRVIVHRNAIVDCCERKA